MSTEIEEVSEQVEEENEEPYDVILNIYDVTSPLNPFFRFLGLGFYLTSVEVDGEEYTFRADDGEEESGIVTGARHDVNLRDSVIIGTTQLKISQILEKIESLRKEFRGDSYNFFTKNCNHFSDWLCKELTGNGIPACINRITKIGVLCRCFLPGDDLNGELRKKEINADNDDDDNNNDDEDQGSFDVYINVYDISKVGSPLMRLLGVGLYRSTIQVHGREYAFRSKPKDGRTEYIISAPEGELDWCKGLRLHKLIWIGRTQLNDQQVSNLVFGLQDEFNLASYHHFTRNNHHFTHRVCRELTGNGMPTWVNRITMIWTLCKCVLPPDPEELRMQERRSPRNI